VKKTGLSREVFGYLYDLRYQLSTHHSEPVKRIVIKLDH